jgi:hypothetical protein
MRCGANLGLLILCALSTAVSLPATTPAFLADDPLMVEPETQDASAVKKWDIDLFIDLAINLFGEPGDKVSGARAGNVNTIDEVPDSNWFTNRILARPLPIADAVRGPAQGTGVAAGRWTVIATKDQGYAPGFTIRDAGGQEWFVSFDARGQPEAATGAIAVATRIFWTLGYWQTDNVLTSIRPDQVDVGEEATITPPSGKERRMRRSDLEEVWRRANQSVDGSYRAIASRRLSGRVIGGFRYHGTRPDDPNDIVPHEHRRELRALKVFGAWTNLVDMKAGNTLDVVIEDRGRSVVRHYLQDVGSTFGTGALAPRDGDEGYEYIYEGGPTAKRLFTLGLAISPWQTVDFEEHPEIGKFEGDQFEPEKWKPRVPVAALRHARADDTLWAALRVMAFTDEQIRAAVKTGGYTDPAAEELHTSVLIKRRDKIGRAYFTNISPLTRFALDEAGVLTFENPAVKAKLAEPPKKGYQTVWNRFDNAARTAQPIGSATPSQSERVQGPSDLPKTDGSFVKVSISALEPAHPAWAKPVDVYFKRAGGAWRLVGVERLPDA